MEATRFRPIDDQILIRRDAAETITAGGVHVPDRDAARPLRGTVLAVGPGRIHRDVRVPCQILPGDLVLHGKYVGTDLQLDGQDCLVLRESEILGVIDLPETPVRDEDIQYLSRDMMRELP